MKVAILSTFYPFRGGIAQFNALLYRALSEQHEVHAYTFKRQYPNMLFPGETQFVTEEDAADPIPAKRLLDTINPLTFSKTARIIKRQQPDLILTKYWMTFFGPSLGAVLKRMPSSCIRVSILDNVIPHEKRFFDKPANRYFLKHNDGFVVMSDAVLRDLLSLKPDARYLRIDHPVYNQFGDRIPTGEARKLLSLPEGKKYLLFFGIIRDYKGLDVMLEALSLLPEEYHLIVAGESYGSFDKYAAIIEQHQLKKRISLFNSYISDHEVTRYFSAADVCMLPYKSATQSGITAISHHFNTPIIATDVGGLKETIRHGETGLIVDAPRADLIATAVENYFSGSHQEHMAQAIAQEKGENSWERFAEKVIEFAQSLKKS